MATAFVAAAVFPQFSRAEDKPVSFYRDVRPLLTANCNACHKPDKMKAELDMTTYAALMKGGKHGKTVVASKPDDSRLIEEISGDDASMPKDGDPLKAAEVALIVRWIEQGAKDDTPAPGTAKVKPPVYAVPPTITSLAYSPDGSLLAVGGYHEVVLHKSDGSGIVARLVGEMSRIESIAFSKDGKQLAVAGGAPAEFGQVQIWDVATAKNLKTFQPSGDSLYGVSLSPDGKTVACGAADKIVRRINIEDGKVLTEFKAHADWVLATCFTLDGKQMVSGGRDKALKLIDVESGRFVDDVNNPLEAVLCMARHPSQDSVLYGGDLGGARLYKISDNQVRTSGRNDANLLVTFERQPGPVNAVAFSPDGGRVALASIGEVRVYAAGGTGTMKAVAMNAAAPVKGAKGVKKTYGEVQSNSQLILPGHTGAVFAVSWKSDGSTIATAGFDGMVRLFDAKTGTLVKEFVPVPIDGKVSSAAIEGK
jgi:WD40 repeat protein/mono/diheme cytochrome c family protein